MADLIFVQWTPLHTFICTFLSAALGGFAVLLRDHDTPLEVRTVLAACLYYGLAGMFLGMVGFNWLGGDRRPWVVIGMGGSVGLRAIRISDLSKVARGMLPAAMDDNAKTKE